MSFCVLFTFLLPIFLAAAGFMEGEPVEKFVPARNQEYLRISSYNAKYLLTSGEFDAIYMDFIGMKSVIISFQEVPKLTAAPRRAILDGLLESVGYFYRCEGYAEGSDTGTMLASLIPIQGCSTADLGNGKSLAHITVEHRGAPLEILATHFEVKDETLRNTQVAALKEYVEENSLAENQICLAMDFENTPNNKIIWNIRKALGLEDAFRIIGWTRPNYATWSGDMSDLMMLSKNLERTLVGTYKWGSYATGQLCVVIDLFQGLGPIPEKCPLKFVPIP